MSTPFLGEIKMFAGNFAPQGFALCDGQLLAISQNLALFALFGTTYGGDGRTTFGLPDFRGRVPIHVGNGPGLTSRRWGERSGSENETITTNQLPSHSHTAHVSSNPANSANPAGKVLAKADGDAYYDSSSTVNMHASSVGGGDGGGQSHSNMMPYTCINFIVALTGVFPSRS